jgi:pimeloyl-ACP methyl ester carboxylesterase
MPTPELLTIHLREGHIAKALVAGEGKPAVFLHGGGGLKWDAYLEELAKERKVYAPYFPGTNGTSGSIQLDLRNWWDVVLYYYDLFDLLGLDHVDVIGHSFGGMLAAELAATDPKRVNHLLLVCPAGLWNEDIPMTQDFLPEELNSKLFYDVHIPAAKVYTTVPEDPNELLPFLVEQQVVMAEVSRYMWPLPDKGLRRRLHRIRADTCIVWGKEDAIIPVGYAYEFQKRIPGAQVEIFEKSSHFPQLEQLSGVLKTTLSLFASGTAKR